jgi:transcription elongation factor GreB
LQKELSGLWVRRREVVRALSAAAAEGDRSENAEYIYRKKELGGIDGRIRYLQKRLPDLQVVRTLPSGDAVFFGAFVEVSDAEGETRTYRIVGPDEIDPKKAAISIDSPMARALLKKRVDDEVTLAIDGNETTLTVVSIRYEA